MKTKNLFTSLAVMLLVVLSVTALTACAAKHNISTEWTYDETNHWHVCTTEGHTDVEDFGAHSFVEGATRKCSVCGYEIQFTEGDNFSYWLAGRDDAKNNKHSEYSYKYLSSFYLGETLYIQESEEEAFAAGKMFEKKKYEILDDKAGVMLTEREVISAVKNVTVDGAQRTKVYTYSKSYNSEPTIQASYEWPDLLEKYGYFNGQYLIQNYLEDYCINEGTTWAEICAEINEGLEDEYGVEADSITLTRNSDGSVTLAYTLTCTDNLGLAEEGYQNSRMECIGNIIVKDGKIIELKNESVVNNIFTDESKNNQYTILDSLVVSYVFDDETYDAISVETETTTNNLTGDVTFVVEGCSDHRLSLSKLVGETLTPAEVRESINSNLEFLIVSSGDDKSKYYEIYTDEEMTQHFTGETMTREMTLYVKLVPPSDKAIVVTYFHRGDRTAIKLIYATYDEGYVYNQQTHFSDYPIISIDGEQKTSVTCVGGSVHKVVYQAPDNLIF